MNQDEASLEKRIDKLARGDRYAAVIFTSSMWLALIFTYLSVVRLVPAPSVGIILALALLVLGGINTVSIIAMIRGFSRHRLFIYADDIANIDKNSERKRTATAPSTVNASTPPTR